MVLGPTLLDDIVSRLDADERVDDASRELVYGALLGELDAILEGRALPRRETSEKPAVEAPEVTLDAIAVRGFRGIGERSVLKLSPGPGLTLVCGRNGSGKSSFAEALELLLTGDNQRWSSRRSRIWRDGWRNLHDGSQVQLEARLLVAGRGAVAVRRVWSADEPLEGGSPSLAFERDAPAQGGADRSAGRAGDDRPAASTN